MVVRSNSSAIERKKVNEMRKKQRMYDMDAFSDRTQTYSM